MLGGTHGITELGGRVTRLHFLVDTHDLLEPFGALATGHVLAGVFTAGLAAGLAITTSLGRHLCYTLDK